MASKVSNKTKTSNNIWIAIIIGISLISVALIITNYFKKQNELLLLNEQSQTAQKREEEEQAKLEAEQKEMEDKLAYVECLESAYDTYIEDWNSNCKNFSLGSDKSGGDADCLLPERIADVLEDQREDSYDRCETLFLD